MFVNTESAIGKIAIYVPAKMRNFFVGKEKQSLLRWMKANLYLMSAGLFV